MSHLTINDVKLLRTTYAKLSEMFDSKMPDAFDEALPIIADFTKLKEIIVIYSYDLREHHGIPLDPVLLTIFNQLADVVNNPVEHPTVKNNQKYIDLRPVQFRYMVYAAARGYSQLVEKILDTYTLPRPSSILAAKIAFEHGHVKLFTMLVNAFSKNQSEKGSVSAFAKLNFNFASNVNAANMLNELKKIIKISKE